MRAYRILRAEFAGEALGLMSDKRNPVSGGMDQGHIMSVSWGDHLLFGEGDGRLGTPDALESRTAVWRDELGARILHWRIRKTRTPGHFQTASGQEHPIVASGRDIDWDDFGVVPEIAHGAGLAAYMYVSLLDNGWPLLPPDVRRVSYHNAMHGREICWQNDFTRGDPDLQVVDRSGEVYQWGVPCLAYPEVRSHYRKQFTGLIEGTEFDGLFVCLRSQSRPAEFADQFGFNEPIRRQYLSEHGKDICRETFNLQAWRDLSGRYLTMFLEALRTDLSDAGYKLALGVSRGDILGPPLGNATMDWRHWVEHDLVDHLVMNQNSRRCPSTWIDFWPMHRNSGYLEDYTKPIDVECFLDRIRLQYAPLFTNNKAELYIARQWDERDEKVEAAMCAEPAVDGLVFSSFRYDNPEALDRADWRA